MSDRTAAVSLSRDCFYQHDKEYARSAEGVGGLLLSPTCNVNHKPGAGQFAWMGQAHPRAAQWLGVPGMPEDGDTPTLPLQTAVANIQWHACAYDMHLWDGRMGCDALGPHATPLQWGYNHPLPQPHRPDWDHNFWNETLIQFIKETQAYDWAQCKHNTTVITRTHAERGVQTNGLGKRSAMEDSCKLPVTRPSTATLSTKLLML